MADTPADKNQDEWNEETVYGPSTVARLIVKGVRGAQDADFEAPQAALNLEVGGVDTWWIPARPGLGHVSSSAVRELLSLKKDISRYVPPALARYLTDNRN